MTHSLQRGRELHVRAGVPESRQDGSKEAPFATIQQAADIARPYDTVVVHDGIYRENVNPKRGGFRDDARITYTVAEGEHAVIKGSEIVEEWENVEGTVWHARIPNMVFGDFNPYDTALEGDWLEQPSNWKPSLGDVYLNGRSLYEAPDLDAVIRAERRETGPGPDWMEIPLTIPRADETIFQWYAKVEDNHTDIWANFHEFDPNRETVEINVRKECFYPQRTGIDYITVRGFEMAQAACPWAPPTGDQPGLIGPHWSRGWIIEGNDIHDAKCSAVSLGKEYSTGDNEAFRWDLKPGYQCQLETVFRARHIGWDKEHVGSHIVRNNTIHDCGQNGVVGHLGCVFSTIENNEIYNIGTKYEYFGHEIAGIKLHAAIDVQLRSNRIHDCTLGTWLDWQAQGTRVSSNVYYANVRDFMIEVTHGPCLFDNNVFASPYNFDNMAWGSAFVHNLFLGSTRKRDVRNRFTPYHLPHSTQILGTACVYGNDERFYQNIFAAPKVLPGNDTRDTSVYDGAPTSHEEFTRRVHDQGIGDLEIFETIPEAMYVDGNAYLNGTHPFDREEHSYSSSKDPRAAVVTDEDGSLWCELILDETIDVETTVIDTATLGAPRIVGEAYENPDGSPIVVDHDINGEPRNEHPVPGPFSTLQTGMNRIRLA
ncbi:right-handed parallel beta-helix repeat-containing protein [Bifidobacterium catulorum]|uniref:Uncharacterized protein n=1 Tax=Bifidobacterium catulorum TaxID=1630173 RepID=A0A2U2MSQ7_9BIFI|nr:right-handed parallel beta-helix repeat-containing protein [Bifidobacterium catulorum]PWG59875.1 hypothetical protein DF200_05525 [Bifidobacterium catulorum]